MDFLSDVLQDFGSSQFSDSEGDSEYLGLFPEGSSPSPLPHDLLSEMPSLLSLDDIVNERDIALALDELASSISLKIKSEPYSPSFSVPLSPSSRPTSPASSNKNTALSPPHAGKHLNLNHGQGGASLNLTKAELLRQTHVLQTITAEERSLIEQEGYLLPLRPPLTKEQEAEIKALRRKIKNKLSAKDSRRRQKEYITSLEHSNKILLGQVRELDAQNKLLSNAFHTALLPHLSPGEGASPTPTPVVVSSPSTPLSLSHTPTQRPPRAAGSALRMIVVMLMLSSPPPGIVATPPSSFAASPSVLPPLNGGFKAHSLTPHHQTLLHDTLSALRVLPSDLEKEEANLALFSAFGSGEHPAVSFSTQTHQSPSLIGRPSPHPTPTPSHTHHQASNVKTPPQIPPRVPLFPAPPHVQEPRTTTKPQLAVSPAERPAQLPLIISPATTPQMGIRAPPVVALRSVSHDDPRVLAKEAAPLSSVPLAEPPQLGSKRKTTTDSLLPSPKLQAL